VSDRPRPTLFRQPAKATGIPWIGVPSTAAFARRERISPPVSRGRPLAHAAHTFSPWLGDKVLLRALQASLLEPACACSLGVRWIRESRNAFSTS
jgi:hypothetical protein